MWNNGMPEWGSALTQVPNVGFGDIVRNCQLRPCFCHSIQTAVSQRSQRERQKRRFETAGNLWYVSRTNPATANTFAKWGRHVKLAIMAAVTCLLASSSAIAATPCKGAGSVSAKPVLYYTADAAVLDGLEVALQLGLEPATFPSRDIAKQPGACVHASFNAGGRIWTLYGDDEDTPPRWAQSDARTIVYLAAMPPADQAHAWAEARRDHRTGEKTVTFNGMMFALVAADGDKRRIFGFYEALPDDARLSRAMQSAIEGRTPAILGFDVKTGDADEGRMIEPLTLAAVASQGRTAPADKTDPDGVAFDALPDRVAKARLSDLICPLMADTLWRSAIFTSGAADGSQEAGCRYVGERARLAVVVTHAVPGQSMKDAMTRMIAAPMASSAGRPTSTPDPPTASMSGTGVGAAAFFRSRDGAYQGVWGFVRGDWFVEVYAVYVPGDEASVVAAVNTLFAANKAP
jgi:hypothetical protein